MLRQDPFEVRDTQVDRGQTRREVASWNTNDGLSKHEQSSLQTFTSQNQTAGLQATLRFRGYHQTMSGHDLGSNDPLATFGDWLKQAEAAEPNDPNAAALATCTPEGRPSVRMVLV